VALDARVVLHAVPEGMAPYSHLAIRPYPASLEERIELADGASVLVRPIRPDDAALEMELVDGLSAASRRMRFQSALRSLTPEMLARFTQIDYDREMALVAIAQVGGRERQVAVARWVRLPDGHTCEFAIVVADDWQGRGLGRELMACLIRAARIAGLESMFGQVLASNDAMLRFCKALGFTAARDPGDPLETRVTLRVR
jgi:Sortase and related acyltransferases